MASEISRLYDFQPGSRAASGQVDDEFNQLVTAYNTLRNKLKSITDGDSGADFIGSTPLKAGGSSTVQGQLKELYVEESLRVQNENIRKSNEIARITAEDIRQDNEEIRQEADILRGQTVEAIEQHYAPRLTLAETQINDLKSQKAEKTEVNATNLRIDNLVIPISPENVNIEVTDAHNSIVKNKNFASIKDRFEESEQDLESHKLDYATQRQQDQLLFDGKIENRKPNYGVDSQSYYERRDRLPYTANEYFKAPISNPNTDIDGYSAFGQKHAPGVIFGIKNTFETPIDMTNCQYISFDYYCTDLNLASIRIDIRSGSNVNFFRHRLNLANLEIGVNHIILNKSDFTEIGGSPSWNNITSVYIRGVVSSVGSHTWAIGDVHIYRFIPTITLWFDDQLKSVYTVAKPIMDTYGFLGVQSVIGARVNLGPAYQAPLELAEMVASGWEHTNHTWLHEKFGETTLERAVYSLQRGLDYCLSHGFGKGSYYFVNPGGQSTPETEPYEKKYSTLRRRGIGINKFPIVDMYDIKSREPAWSDNFNPTVKAWVDDAVLNGHWLILLFHGIKPSSEGSASSFWSTENFTALCQYLSQQQALGNLHVRTCTEALLQI